MRKRELERRLRYAEAERVNLERYVAALEAREDALLDDLRKYWRPKRSETMSAIAKRELVDYVDDYLTKPVWLEEVRG